MRIRHPRLSIRQRPNGRQISLSWGHLSFGQLSRLQRIHERLGRYLASGTAHCRNADSERIEPRLVQVCTDFLLPLWIAVPPEVGGLLQVQLTSRRPVDDVSAHQETVGYIAVTSSRISCFLPGHQLVESRRPRIDLRTNLRAITHSHAAIQPPPVLVATRLELFLYLTAISLGFAFLQGIIQIGHILMVEEVVLRRVLRYPSSAFQSFACHIRIAYRRSQNTNQLRPHSDHGFTVLRAQALEGLV
ncbi:Uncharacterised protein [Acinetobacter baumannii]|nr:Uncharacterised protein [Acinetobacter baumannii]